MINIRSLMDSPNFKGFMDRVKSELEDVRSRLESERDADERLRLQGDIRALRKIIDLPEAISIEQEMDREMGLQE